MLLRQPQVEHQPGVLHQQRRQRLRNQPGVHMRRRDPHRARVLRQRAPVDAVKKFVHAAHGHAGALGQLAPEIGELHAARAAVKERLAQFFFEFAHRARHHLRRHRQAHGRLAEVGGIGGGEEHAQGFEAVGHGVFLIWEF
ncbi:hypothetical protein D9M69_536780 [compost metagenome]